MNPKFLIPRTLDQIEEDKRNKCFGVDDFKELKNKSTEIKYSVDLHLKHFEEKFYRRMNKKVFEANEVPYGFLITSDYLSIFNSSKIGKVKIIKKFIIKNESVTKITHSFKNCTPFNFPRQKVKIDKILFPQTGVEKTTTMTYTIKSIRCHYFKEIQEMDLSFTLDKHKETKEVQTWVQPKK